MPYFYKTDTLEVVYRAFEINMESINGELALLPPHHPCLLISHIPNNKQGYDIAVLGNYTPEDGIEKIEKLGKKENNVKNGPHYAIIPSDKFIQYKNNKSFTLLEKLPITKAKPNKIKNFYKNPSIPEIPHREEPLISDDGVSPKKVLSGGKYKPSLAREVGSEKPIKAGYF